MRGYAREAAFCKVYSFIMTDKYDGDFSAFEQEKLTDDDIKFADSLVCRVVEEKAQLDSVIAELSKSFKLSRIYRIDLALLELAIAEMRYFDTPAPVVINEAVGLAKKYSTEKSVSFVNGVLAGYLRSVES